jgi:hypothetical protein
LLVDLTAGTRVGDRRADTVELRPAAAGIDAAASAITVNTTMDVRTNDDLMGQTSFRRLYPGAFEAPVALRAKAVPLRAFHQPVEET